MNVYEIIFKKYPQGELLETNFTGETFDEAYIRIKKWLPDAIIKQIKQIK